ERPLLSPQRRDVRHLRRRDWQHRLQSLASGRSKPCQIAGLRCSGMFARRLGRMRTSREIKGTRTSRGIESSSPDSLRIRKWVRTDFGGLGRATLELLERVLTI